MATMIRMQLIFRNYKEKLLNLVKNLTQAALLNSKLPKLSVIVKGREEMPRSTDAILSLERQQPWLSVEINVEVP